MPPVLGRSPLDSERGMNGGAQPPPHIGGRSPRKVLLDESDEGFSVSCPGLPGCWSQGATKEEALQNIQDAIAEYLAAVNAI